jgi:hypothetical protein
MAKQHKPMDVLLEESATDMATAENSTSNAIDNLYVYNAMAVPSTGGRRAISRRTLF